MFRIGGQGWSFVKEECEPVNSLDQLIDLRLQCIKARVTVKEYDDDPRNPDHRRSDRDPRITHESHLTNRPKPKAPSARSARNTADGVLERTALVLDFLLQKHDRVDQLLRPRRATGYVDVNWNVLVHALNDGIVVEHAP
jgi:hypothetical protein